MNRKAWLGLPLAFVLGCHQNLLPDHGDCNSGGCGLPAKHGCGHGCMHGGGGGLDMAMARRFANTQTQVAFVSPVGMSIGWEASTGTASTVGVSVGGAGVTVGTQAPVRTFMPSMLTVPGRYNFEQGAIYRLKITNIPGHPGVPFYPTLEIAPSSPRTDAYLTHNAVPIEFTDEDFDQVSAGNFVTKVIYLPDPQHQELAIAGVETLVSTRLDPGVDPIAEADRRGTILAIVRLGGIDLEMPQAAAASAAAYTEGQVVQMADNGGRTVTGQPVFTQESGARSTLRR